MYCPDPPTRIGSFSAVSDFQDRVACIPQEFAQTVRLIRIKDVYEVVFHSLTFRLVRFRRADIHSSIEESGIGIHYFAVEAPSNFNPQRSLASRRRADYRYDAKRIGPRFTFGHAETWSFVRLSFGHDLDHG